MPQNWFLRHVSIWMFSFFLSSSLPLFSIGESKNVLFTLVLWVWGNHNNTTVVRYSSSILLNTAKSWCSKDFICNPNHNLLFLYANLTHFLFAFKLRIYFQQHYQGEIYETKRGHMFYVCNTNVAISILSIVFWNTKTATNFCNQKLNAN